MGGACRYLATRALDSRLGTRFPWGTLAVNVSGAFLAGLVAGLLDECALSGRSRVMGLDLAAARAALLGGALFDIENAI